MSLVEIPKEYAQTEYFPDLCMICAKKPVETKFLHKFTAKPSYDETRLPTPLILRHFFPERQSKTAVVNLHLCRNCAVKFDRMTTFTWLMGIGALLFFILSFPLFAVGKTVPAFLCLAAAILIPVIYYVGFHRKWTISCSKVLDEVIQLELPNEKYTSVYREAYYKKWKHERYLDEKSICRNCGMENAPGSRFCEKCRQPFLAVLEGDS